MRSAPFVKIKLQPPYPGQYIPAACYAGWIDPATFVNRTLKVPRTPSADDRARSAYKTTDELTDRM